MKRIMAHTGLFIITEDGARPDVIMNYILNSLEMLPQESGLIREVQVREISIPSIEIIREDDKIIDLNHIRAGVTRQ